MTKLSGFLSKDEKEGLNLFSGPIAKCAARRIVDKYDTSLSANSNQPVPLKTSDNKPFRGFYFDIEHVKKLVDLSKVIDIQELYFAVAEYDGGGHTFVMYGVDSGGKLVEMDGLVFDYTELCPNRCPIRTGDTCPPLEE